jgi:CRP/FNR family cyclic AMP-dependent transcriptional regulator
MGRSVPLRLKTAELVSMLGGVDLFSGLNSRELRTVAAMAKEWEYGPGEKIVEEGDTDGRLHVILEGAASVQVKGKKIDRLRPGSAFGDVAMLDGGPRSATVVAETELRTVSIARVNFRPLLKEQPAIAEKLLVELCRRLREERARAI